MGEQITVGADQLADVAVGIMAVKGCCAVQRSGEEAADAAGALEGVGKVETPSVIVGG